MGTEHLTDTNALPKDEITVAVDDLSMSIVNSVELLPAQRIATDVSGVVEEPTAVNKLATEREFIQKFKDGDISSFESLYQLHASTLHNYVKSKIDIHTAVDICQETFMRCFLKLGQFEDRGKGVMPWLYATAHNLIVDELARRTRKPTNNVTGNENIFTDMIAPDNTELSALGSMVIKKVFQGIGDIQSPMQREAMVEIYLHGKSIADYAEEKEKSVNAVEQLLQRARANLRPLVRRLLSEEGDNTISL